MANLLPGAIHASGSVAGGTGARVSGQGAASARTGAGVYTLTMDGIDAAECAIVATVRAAAGVGSTIDVVHTSDTVKTVHTFDVAAGANVATDHDFDFVVLRTNVG
jgi:hypothetical protein